MRRVFLILAVVLILSLVSVGVLAEEQTLPGEISREKIPFQVNPLYEGLIDPADFVSEPDEETAGEDGLSHTQPTFYSTGTTFATEEEAVEQLREHLKARNESFELYVRSDMHYEELIEAIVVAAMAHTGKPTEGDYLLWQFAGWGAEVYYEQSGSKYNYKYTIQVGYYTTAEQEAQLDTAIDQLLSNLALEGKSDYQKVCAVYDYICANVTYDYENLNNAENLVKYSAYGALINKTAVCQGYSNLLYRLLLELGIDNRIITGETLEGPHAWNIVRLGDVYYNVDVTWDAGVDQYNYFLRNSENFLDHYRNMEYMIAEFQLVYPISATDYVDGVAGMPGFEPVWGICGDDAMWVLDYDGVLTIAGTGATYDHNKEDNIPLWYFWQDCFDTVVIEEGITRLGAYSFYDMDALASVYMPDTLLIISAGTFSGCDGLKQITIPDSVTNIGGYAFFYCESLENVTLGESLEKIGLCAFEGCVKLKQIHFPDSLREIGLYAFSNCDALRELTIPASVEKIEFSFQSCDSLETLYFNGRNMDARNFTNCKNLQNLVFTDNLRGYTASYSGCDLITDLIVPASVTLFYAGGSDQLKTIRFLGDAPKLYDFSFENVTATVYYPADNPTWTEEVMQQYGGTITWLPDNGQVPEEPEIPDEPEVPDEPTGVLGDVSGDGILDSYDATLILQYDVGMITGDTIRMELADVSGDGVVDSYDATLILQYDVGMITKFPAA